MSVGQQIVFDEKHCIGVYSRVMSKKTIVEDIYANQEKYVDKELDHHTKVALRELALEEARKKNYPAYPSRMGCLYVSNTLEDANRWFDFFTRLGRPTLQIVKVEVTGQVFEGNANRCFEGSKYSEISGGILDKRCQIGR